MEAKQGCQDEIRCMYCMFIDTLQFVHKCFHLIQAFAARLPPTAAATAAAAAIPFVR